MKKPLSPDKGLIRQYFKNIYISWELRLKGLCISLNLSKKTVETITPLSALSNFGLCLGHSRATTIEPVFVLGILSLQQNGQ